MTTLIPGNQQVLTYRDIRTALGLEAKIDLLEELKAEPEREYLAAIPTDAVTAQQP